MLTDGRTDDGRTTDAGVTGILIAHLGAFGSGELKITREFDQTMTQPQTKARDFRTRHGRIWKISSGGGGRGGRPDVICVVFSHQCILKTRSNFTVLFAIFSSLRMEIIIRCSCLMLLTEIQMNH